MARKFKSKTCKECKREYTPTSPYQFYCHTCKPLVEKRKKREQDRIRSLNKPKAPERIAWKCTTCGYHKEFAAFTKLYTKNYRVCDVCLEIRAIRKKNKKSRNRSMREIPAEWENGNEREEGNPCSYCIHEVTCREKVTPPLDLDEESRIEMYNQFEPPCFEYGRSQDFTQGIASEEMHIAAGYICKNSFEKE